MQAIDENGSTTLGKAFETCISLERLDEWFPLEASLAPVPASLRPSLLLPLGPVLALLCLAASEVTHLGQVTVRLILLDAFLNELRSILLPAMFRQPPSLVLLLVRYEVV